MTGRARGSWIAGLVVGAAGGFLALEFPTLGWLILVLFAAPAAIVGPRALAISGLLTGFGAIWLALLGRVAITCRAANVRLPGARHRAVAGGRCGDAGDRTRLDDCRLRSRSAASLKGYEPSVMKARIAAPTARNSGWFGSMATLQVAIASSPV